MNEDRLDALIAQRRDARDNAVDAHLSGSESPLQQSAALLHASAARQRQWRWRRSALCVAPVFAVLTVGAMSWAAVTTAHMEEEAALATMLLLHESVVPEGFDGMDWFDNLEG